jgi:hypothetical protein
MFKQEDKDKILKLCDEHLRMAFGTVVSIILSNLNTTDNKNKLAKYALFYTLHKYGLNLTVIQEWLGVSYPTVRKAIDSAIMIIDNQDYGAVEISNVSVAIYEDYMK